MTKILIGSSYEVRGSSDFYKLSGNREMIHIIDFTGVDIILRIGFPTAEVYYT